MRKFVSALLSLFTVTGGHFYNRRLDLGLLFLVLLVVMPMVSSLILPILWALEYRENIWEGSLMYGVVFAMVTMGAMLLITSVIVSYRKAEEATERLPLGKTGLAAALLATLLSIVAMVRLGIEGMHYIEMAEFDFVAVAHDVEEEAEPDSSITIRTRFFQELVRYGGNWVPEEILEPMPNGDAYVTGRLQYMDQPVVGATLVMVFNSRYMSKQITTDEQGVFSLTVPEGEWTLNRIKIDGWPDRPSGGSFTVIGGPNPDLQESMYRSGPSFGADGYLLSGTKIPEIMPGLDLSINANVELQWPQRSRQATDMRSDRISWKPRAEAASYQVQLHRIQKRGSSITYSPVAWINTSEQEVRMSDFQAVTDDSGGDNEYGVEVYAFDADGELLSESSKFIDGRSLLLKGKRVVKTENLYSLEGLSDMSLEEMQEKVEAEYRDEKRLQAAELLAREGMTEPARTLLERVQSESFELKKLTTMGLILAGEGRCEESRRKFEEANKRRGSDCLPELFKKQCGAE